MMKNKTILLMSAVIALSTYQVAFSITQTQRGIVAENAKKVTNILNTGLELENIVEVKNRLNEIKKYDVFTYEKLNDQFEESKKDLPIKKFLDEERGVEINIDTIELLREARLYIDRFKENLNNTFNNTGGNSGQKWFATYNFALENFTGYLYNELLVKYFEDQIMPKLENLKPTDTAVKSREKINVISLYLEDLILNITDKIDALKE